MPKQPEAGMSWTSAGRGAPDQAGGELAGQSKRKLPGQHPGAGGLRGDPAAEDKALAIPSLLP